MSAAPAYQESLPLLLTLLSVLLTVGFVTALVVALFLILTPLQAVRGSLERIAWGVRAIEHQLAPLDRHVRETAAAAGDCAGTLRGAADALHELDRTLESAAPHLTDR